MKVAVFYIQADDPICLLAWEELKDKDDDTWERSMNSPLCHERSSTSLEDTSYPLFFPFRSFPLCSLPLFHGILKIEFAINTRAFLSFLFFLEGRGNSFKILEFLFFFFFPSLKSTYTSRVRETRGTPDEILCFATVYSGLNFGEHRGAS